VSSFHSPRRPPAPSDDWWVLLVSDGLSIEFAPELYREHDDAEREGERWAQGLSRRSSARIERPFPDRWHIGDEWIRITPANLSVPGSEIWVGTYWTQDGFPDPEAEIFHDAVEAHAWVLEAPPDAILIGSYEAPASIIARYRVRGGEEEAEAHRAKLVADLPRSLHERASEQIAYGFEVSEGLIPQGPDLFSTESTCGAALRGYWEHQLNVRDWRDLVAATAVGNYVDGELPLAWQETWDAAHALKWLLGFDFVTDGDDFELRRFETSLQ
jgi:hypothetical protein